MIVQRLALWLEDAAVGFQQVTALHSLGSRPRADQERDVHPVECVVGIVAYVDSSQQWERTIVDLHRCALDRLQRAGISSRER